MKIHSVFLVAGIMVTSGVNAGFFDFLKGLVKGNTTFVIPSENADATKYHVFAINSGGGEESAGVAEAIEKRFASIKINDKPYFAQIYRDVGVKAGSFDFATIAVDAGRSSFSEDSGLENRVKCPKGKIVCSDDKAYHYTVRCVTRKAFTPVSINVRDGATGASIYSDRKDVTSESKLCSDTGGSLQSGNALVVSNYETVANNLASRFAPRFERRSLDLVSSDDSITGENADKLKAAYELASKNDLAGASKIYDEMNAAIPNKGVLLFNMGYCRQAIGEYAKANELYEMASRAEAPPKEEIAKYHDETKVWINKGITTLSISISPEALSGAKINLEIPKVSSVTPASSVTQSASVASNQGDVSQRLRQLKALYEDGIISKPEFEEKRKRLLEAM